MPGRWQLVGSLPMHWCTLKPSFRSSLGGSCRCMLPSCCQPSPTRFQAVCGSHKHPVGVFACTCRFIATIQDPCKQVQYNDMLKSLQEEHKLLQDMEAAYEEMKLVPNSSGRSSLVSCSSTWAHDTTAVGSVRSRLGASAAFQPTAQHADSSAFLWLVSSHQRCSVLHIQGSSWAVRMPKTLSAVPCMCATAAGQPLPEPSCRPGGQQQARIGEQTTLLSLVNTPALQQQLLVAVCTHCKASSTL